MRFVKYFVGIILLNTSCGWNGNSFLSNEPQIFVQQSDLPEMGPQPYYIEGQINVVEPFVSNKVDILVSAENSGSMAMYDQSIKDGFRTLVADLEQSGLDYQIGIVKSNSLADGSHSAKLFGAPAIVKRGDRNPSVLVQNNLTALSSSYQGSDSLPLQIFNEAIHDPGNKALFRPDATKLFVMISDSEDIPNTSPLITDLVSSFSNISNSYRWEFVSLGSIKDHDCPHSEPYTYTAHNLAQLYGVSGGVCAKDISAPISYAFNVVDPVDSIATDPKKVFTSQNDYVTDVLVDGKLLPKMNDVNSDTGWWFDSQGFVRFGSASVPKGGQKIQVKYKVSYER